MCLLTAGSRSISTPKSMLNRAKAAPKNQFFDILSYPSGYWVQRHCFIDHLKKLVRKLKATTMKRRNFSKSLAASAALLGLSPIFSCTPAQRSLKILVLGGTDFLGPAVVKAALQNGHQVTLFNRGITNPALFSQLPLIRGDRENGASAYEALKKTSWDVVIDVWPQQSQLVKEATTALRSHTAHYIFISSVAVYKDFNATGRSEDYPLVSLPEDHKTWEYPEEKAASEALIADQFADNHTILRPGPIKGWRDPAYDLLYWLIKLKRNESILCPGEGQDVLQFIDVNDVGRFAIKAAENKIVGAYNCVGPGREHLSWRAFMESAKLHLSSESELIWASRSALQEHQVYPWSDLPLWAPTSDDFFMEISNTKALSAGFSYAALEKTIDDCLGWHKEQGDKNILFGQGDDAVGLERAKELAVITALKKS